MTTPVIIIATPLYVLAYLIVGCMVGLYSMFLYALVGKYFDSGYELSNDHTCFFFGITTVILWPFFIISHIAFIPVLITVFICNIVAAFNTRY